MAGSGGQIARHWLGGAIGAALLMGCASTGERHAWGEFRQAGSAIRAGESQAKPATDLPTLTNAATLADYLTYAGLNNPNLEAAFYRWKAALEEVPQRTAFPDPQFTYTHFIREVETRVGPQRQKLGVAQTLPWFGKLGLRGRIALAEARAAGARFRRAKLDLFRRVKHAYHEYAYLTRAIEITAGNLELLTRIESVARRQYASGTAPHDAVIKAQVELGRIEDHLRSLRLRRVPAAAELNAALGRDPAAPLPELQPAIIAPLGLADIEIRTLLREQNPQLRELDFLIAKERLSRSLAGKAYYPDLTLGAELIDTGEARMHGVEESGKDPLAVRLSVSLPFWFGKHRAAGRAAEARHQAAHAARRDAELRLLARAEAALYQLHDAEGKIDLYQNSLIGKARQSLSVARRSFAAGRSSFLDLIEAQRTLLDFEFGLERAIADRAQTLAEVEMLTGEAVLPVHAGPEDQSGDIEP